MNFLNKHQVTAKVNISYVHHFECKQQLPITNNAVVMLTAHNKLPMHLPFGPVVNPVVHLQSNPPSMFIQTPFPHMSLVWHSSLSTENETYPVDLQSK